MIIRCYKGSVQKPQPRNLTAMGGASCPGAFAILSRSNVAKIQSLVIFSIFFMSLTKKVTTEAIMCHLIHGCRCFYPNDIFSKEGKHNMFCSQTCHNKTLTNNFRMNKKGSPKKLSEAQHTYEMPL